MKSYVFVNSPIEDIVVLKPFPDKKITENLAKVRIIWLVVETKGASVIEIDCELIRKTTTKHFGWSCHLLFHNSVIFLLLCSRLKTLPREGAAAKIKHDITKRLHIITPGLF
jgi:hypothetical protein